MTAQSGPADAPGVGFGGACAWRCLGDDGALADLRRRMARGRPATPACALTCSDVKPLHTYAYGLTSCCLCITSAAPNLLPHLPVSSLFCSLSLVPVRCCGE